MKVKVNENQQTSLSGIQTLLHSMISLFFSQLHITNINSNVFITINLSNIFNGVNKAKIIIECVWQNFFEQHASNDYIYAVKNKDFNFRNYHRLALLVICMFRI